MYPVDIRFISAFQTFLKVFINVARTFPTHIVVLPHYVNLSNNNFLYDPTAILYTELHYLWGVFSYVDTDREASPITGVFPTGSTTLCQYWIDYVEKSGLQSVFSELRKSRLFDRVNNLSAVLPPPHIEFLSSQPKQKLFTAGFPFEQMNPNCLLSPLKIRSADDWKRFLQLFVNNGLLQTLEDKQTLKRIGLVYDEMQTIELNKKHTIHDMFDHYLVHILMVLVAFDCITIDKAVEILTKKLTLEYPSLRYTLELYPILMEHSQFSLWYTDTLVRRLGRFNR